MARALERVEAKRAKAQAEQAASGGRSRDDEGGAQAGLRNQGNTCYLNSLVQAMYHAPGLREAVKEAAESGEFGDSDAVSALARVFKGLDERRG